MRFALILSLIIAAVAIVFTLQNTAEVAVNVGPYVITSSLAVVLLVTLSAGVLVGLLASLPSRIAAGRRAKKAERELEALRSSLQGRPAQPSSPKVVPADPTAGPPPAKAPSGGTPSSDASETQRLADEVAQRTQQTTGKKA